jgi:hypothetical protein
MNGIESKGRSPFYPDQPVPVEWFHGRKEQIQHILQRGVGQVAAGKPVTMFVEGEYGIGKSSIAAFAQWQAEMGYGLHGIYVSLGTARALDQVAEQILAATVRSGVFHPTRGEKVRNWLAKFVGQQQLFGFSLNLATLKQEAPTLASVGNLLQFLGETIFRLQDTGVRGVFLIFDEINGITGNSDFAHFLKGLVDGNALSRPPVPLLLMLCGVQERRRELVQMHEPVGRIFDIVQVERMTEEEMRNFYSASFAGVGMQVNDEAMNLLVEYAAGFPKIMHLIGNAAYWQDQDGVVDENDALMAIVTAAAEVGNRYVTQQVYRVLRSKDYHSILGKIAKTGIEMTFQKAEIAKELTEAEQKKFNNFLQRMKQLNVIRSGEAKGEYIFNVRMVRLFIWLDGLRKQGVSRKRN